MKIISDYRKDTKSNKPNPGSYEWWYFDSLSEDGKTGIVIIFYDGNPFSRRYIERIDEEKDVIADDFPAISISVYHNGETIYYGFEEVNPVDSNFGETKPSGRIKKNTFHLEEDGESLTYKVKLDQKLPSGDFIEGELSFKSDKISFDLTQNDHGVGSATHQWNLVQPGAAVSGEIQIGGFKSFQAKFDGRGYHDHNVGAEPMKESFREWYWGRVHFSDSVLIYYMMNEDGVWENKAWILCDKEVQKGNNPVTIQTGKARNIFGLKSARKIELRSENFNFFVQKNRVIDNGPFYQRFISRVIVDRAGKTEQGFGFSEYINPSKIYSRIFWPLVNMRIHYPEKTHWVQKSPKLSRITW